MQFFNKIKSSKENIQLDPKHKFDLNLILWGEQCKRLYLNNATNWKNTIEQKRF